MESKAHVIIEKMSDWELNKKNKFLEKFLKNMTVMNRAIWDDNEFSESEKLDCLKWSNELAHRIWNLKDNLEQAIDQDSGNQFLSHILFYRNQQPKLGGHLGGVLKLTYNSLE